MIQNPILRPAAERSPVPKQSILVLGKKSLLKGIDRLPTIFSELPSSAKWHLSVVGPSPDQSEALEVENARIALAETFGQRLRWYPTQLSVEELYAGATCLLLASRSDSRPRVVEEALARGVPVIASDLQGVREIAACTLHGDAIQFLGSAPLIDMLERADALRRSCAGKPLIQIRTIESITDEWRQVLAPLCNG
jgi:hypothetical protein